MVPDFGLLTEAQARPGGYAEAARQARQRRERVLWSIGPRGSRHNPRPELGAGGTARSKARLAARTEPPWPSISLLGYTALFPGL
eukprot:4721529-Alexandrium_andersonii.AAC.1